MGKEQSFFQEERIDRTPYAACAVVIFFGISLLSLGALGILRTSRSFTFSLRDSFQALDVDSKKENAEKAAEAASQSAQNALQSARDTATKTAAEAAENAAKDVAKSATDAATNEAKKQVDSLGNTINSQISR